MKHAVWLLLGSLLLAALGCGDKDAAPTPSSRPPGKSELGKIPKRQKPADGKRP